MRVRQKLDSCKPTPGWSCFAAMNCGDPPTPSSLLSCSMTLRAEQTGLLRDVAYQRLGPDAADVLGALAMRGTATLHELASVSALDDAALRAIVLSLLKHEFAVVDQSEQPAVYRAHIGVALLHAAEAVCVHAIGSYYGAVAELVALNLLAHHDLPRDTIIDNVRRACPGLDAQPEQTVIKLVDDQVLVACQFGDDPNPRVGAKRGIDLQGSLAYQLNWHLLLTRLRNDRILSFARLTQPSDAASKLLRVIVSGDANRGKAWTAAGFPVLHASSSPLSLSHLRRRCSDMSQSSINAAIDSLVCDANNRFLMAHEASAGGEAVHSLDFVNAVAAMRRKIYESTVLGRYGIHGARVLKLLLENSAMEDRFIAEEALVTHGDVRNTLGAMLRDGLVRLLEIPKNAMTAERQPKNAVYVWSLEQEQLHELVSGNVIKSLLNVRLRLREETSKFRSMMPPTFFADPGSAVLSTAESAQVRAFEDVRNALQHAEVSLIERMLVLSYFAR